MRAGLPARSRSAASLVTGYRRRRQHKRGGRVNSGAAYGGSRSPNVAPPETVSVAQTTS